MNLLLELFTALLLLSASGAQFARQEVNNDGRYFPDNSGQYIPDNSGFYIDDGTGRYADDGTGRYKGQRDPNNYENGIGRGNFLGNLLGEGTSNRQTVRPTPSAYIRPSPTIDYNSRPINNQDGKWKIIRQLGDIGVDGNYHWEYETENKIIAEETAQVVNAGSDSESIRAKGFFQYTGPDNVVYSVEYTADENGFVPIGKHI